MYGTPTTDDIVLAGADGLTVERTDENTITFRQGAGSGGGSSYTDNDAKDAAAQALLNGTQLGIAFTYDSANEGNQCSGGNYSTYTQSPLVLKLEDYLFTGSDREQYFH